MEGDYYNALTFAEVFPVTVGAIEAVCIEGDNLLYRGMADDTLTLKYYKKPTDITNVSTEPSELPGHFQRRLLVAYCCREIYADIEDGMEGQKVNTTYWDSKYNKWLDELSLYVRKDMPREPKHIRSFE